MHVYIICVAIDIKFNKEFRFQIGSISSAKCADQFSLSVKENVNRGADFY